MFPISPKRPKVFAICSHTVVFSDAAFISAVRSSVFSAHAHARSISARFLKFKRSPFVAISGNGLKLSLLPHSGESFTFYENLIEGIYLKNGITLKPGSTVVDIGANIGAFTILAASIVGPRGHVFAFEPIKDTFERLQKNVDLNGLKNIECRRAAIDSQEGEITLQVAEKSAYATAHKTTIIGDERPSETVPCLTLDRIFSEFQIDRINLLKIDCEGSEHGSSKHCRVTPLHGSTKSQWRFTPSKEQTLTAFAKGSLPSLRRHFRCDLDRIKCCR